MKARMNRRILLSFLGISLLCNGAQGGVEEHYSVHLLPGERDNEAWLAGIDVRLDPGWKTYWRMPGDAGIPPEFDWTGSQNVKVVDVLWPAPSRHRDAAGETVGYLDRVIFPLRVTPTDPSSPVTLKLSMFFAVCKDVCIPAKAKAEAMLGSLSPDPSVMDDIRRFKALVPGKGQKPVERATVEAGEKKPVLVLHFAGGAAPPNADVFVEGGGSAYFRAPEAGAKPDELRLTIDGLKDVAKLKGKMLKLTLVTPEQGVEQEITVE
jgi:DsbC/DsbD-like thiol-disulfide interchange protein